jgi:sugar O-acyltransferase (sialic acid O-acetyltransferase NeuD family)
MENLIIVGIGTNARHAYEFVKMYNLYNVIGFAVNKQYIAENTFLDLPVYALEDLTECVQVPFKVFVALLWNRLNSDRKKLYDECKSMNLEFANLISPHAIIRQSVTLGNNCWVHDFVVIQNNANLGNDIAIMAFSLIGANTHVGDHCFFGARSLLGGGSTIGEQSFVGINSTVFDDTTIGRKCIIGACTPVKRNMPDFSKYITSSDNIQIKQYTEDEVESKLMFKKNVR